MSTRPRSKVDSIVRAKVVAMSWIDALVRWAKRTGFPWWAILLISLVIVAAAINIVKWLDGTTEFPVIDPFIVNALYVPIGLAGYVLLTRAAGRALDRYLPALDEPAERTARSRARLTTIPLLPSILIPLANLVFTLVQIASEPTYQAQASTSVGAFIVTVTAFTLGYGIGLMTVWQIIRILTEVVSLHRRAAEIDIFRPAPAHAFAPVTAGSGIFLLVLVTFSSLTDPVTFTNAGQIILVIVLIALAVIMFVLPLLGMKGRLDDAKDRAVDENAVRVGRLVAELDRAVDENRLGDVDQIQKSIDALLALGERTRKASTWPWSTRTLGGFASSLLLPIITWLITSAAGRLLGF